MWKWLADVLEWLLEALLWVPRKVWELLLDGLAGVIEAIPVPDFMSGLSGFFGSLDPAYGYFLGALNFGVGFAFVAAALVMRFVIRRIPIIG